MDALLPSEIARLVLGYLQEQKCEEAAKVFLETSPLLQECRIVSQRGGRYSTKVGGLTLLDILDKYCAANVMVQEKLSRASDSEQLRQCNDLLEQLRYLLEGSRGHRFVVNISVPSQGSPAGTFGTPSVSGSTRKRHHSNSERGKRASRSLNSLLEKPTQNLLNQNCDTVEATPLESLPGHKPSTKQINTENHTNILNDKSLTETEITTSILKENGHNFPVEVNTYSDLNSITQNSNTLKSNHKDQSTETVQQKDVEESISKCTAGTSTEELMSYCSAEVQTGPCDLLESESDINDEPIENLSMITKELLNRTELHERIAENINKAILPVEASFREDIVQENATEANLTLLTDFDNAIKSVVQATETDPIFEGFLHEIFKVGEIDTSPDEDSDTRQNQLSNDQNCIRNDEPMEIDNNNELSGPEVPLKQRLRSSSRSQNTNVDEEEKESNNTLLDNQNAEAIMNIVNVIASKRNSLVNNELDTKPVSAAALPENPASDEPPINVKVEPEKNSDDSKATKPTAKKGSTRKTKSSKPKQSTEAPKSGTAAQLIPETDLMPTLILCSETEVESILQSNAMRSQNNDGYFPIAPKFNETISPVITEPPPPTIFLRTVNVPRHLVNPAHLEASKMTNPLLLQKALQLQQQTSPQKLPILGSPDNDPIVVPIVVTDDKPSTVIASSGPAESITLYGGENDTTEVKVAPVTSMPMISIDDSAISLAVGSGLSPFFKGSSNGNPAVIVEETKDEHKKVRQQQVSSEPEKVAQEMDVDADGDVNGEHPESNVLSPAKDTTVTKEEDSKVGSKQENRASMNARVADVIIAKRTPRSLLKSRSKNNRLSLSTPRRRNSHVRALDFNTPVKLSGTTRKIPQSCSRSKSVCRAGLFKSPPFTGGAPLTIALKTTTIEAQSIKKVRTVSPVKHSSAYMRVPIATRSPAPKLQGNWGKVTGIGLILGETSTSESSPEKSQPECPPPSSPITKSVEIPADIAKSVEKQVDIDKSVEKSADVAKPAVDIKSVVKKSWDSDLRKIIGAAVNTEDEEKAKAKSTKKATGRRRNAAAKTEVMEIKVNVKRKNTKEAKKCEDENNTKRNEDVNEEVKESLDKNQEAEKSEDCKKDVRKNEECKKEDKKSEDDNKKIVKSDNDKEANDKGNMTAEVKINIKKSEITPPAAIPVSKRTMQDTAKIAKPVDESSKKMRNSIMTKTSPETLGHISRIPDLLDLETPRKTEVTFYVPQTPRLLTPGDSLIKSNRSKPGDELSIKDCVFTPDFPVTPCIHLTPKIIEEDNNKKPSPYYEPSEEQTQPVKLKEAVNTDKVMVQESVTTLTIQRNVVELQESKTIEITKFGVVEENVAHDEREEELTSEDNSKEIIEEESAVEDTNASANSETDSDNESTDSNSSTSSSTSSNTSSSSSSSCSSTESSPTKSIPRESQNDNSTTESEIDSPERLMQNFSKLSQEELDGIENKIEESSPNKVFSVLKENSDGPAKETPAKEDNGVLEADISVTPSVSNYERALRRDSLTTLTSKISAIITTSQSDHSAKNTITTQASRKPEDTCTVSSSEKIPQCDKAKPKIINVQRIAPADGMALQVSKMLQSGMKKNPVPMVQQPQATNNAKLSLQLEEKRQRVMAKFKESTGVKTVCQPKKSADESKQKKILVTKRNAEAEKVVSSTTDNLRSKAKQVQATDTKQSNKAEKVTKNTEDKVDESPNTKLENRIGEEDFKEVKKKGKASPRKKTVQIDQCSKTESVNTEMNLKKIQKETTQNTAKEVATATVAIAAENSKGISKAKVDQVKRDLFSDEETNDQRTTRSQAARRTIDSQKSDENQEMNALRNNSKEMLPGVLECLQLIPANKSEECLDISKSLSSDGFSNNQIHVQDISHIYDESVPIKKRKRKYSSSELCNEYTYHYPNEVYVLKVTAYEEIFKLAPKTKKKVQSPKKSPVKVKKNKVCDKNIEEPLATSSPLIKTSNSKSGKSHSDDKKKKSCKRKPSPMKEDRQVEKKSKPDPQTLFNKIKIDEFLKSVHVPE